MCILRLSSEHHSFKSILNDTTLPMFSVFDAGEYRDSQKTRLCSSYQATLSISDKEWDDVEGQIEGAISFFESKNIELQKLFELVTDLRANLDFPILSKFDGRIVTQGIVFPSQLTKLAGNLNIGIGLTLYERDFFNEDC